MSAHGVNMRLGLHVVVIYTWPQLGDKNICWGQAVGVGRADTEMHCEYTWHAKQDGRVIEASIPWVWGKVGWVRGAVQTSAPRRGSATLP